MLKRGLFPSLALQAAAAALSRVHRPGHNSLPLHNSKPRQLFKLAYNSGPVAYCAWHATPNNFGTCWNAVDPNRLMGPLPALSACTGATCIVSICRMAYSTKALVMALSAAAQRMAQVAAALPLLPVDSHLLLFAAVC